MILSLSSCWIKTFLFQAWHKSYMVTCSIQSFIFIIQLHYITHIHLQYYQSLILSSSSSPSPSPSSFLSSSPSLLFLLFLSPGLTSFPCYHLFHQKSLHPRPVSDFVSCIWDPFLQLGFLVQPQQEKTTVPNLPATLYVREWMGWEAEVREKDWKERRRRICSLNVN